MELNTARGIAARIWGDPEMSLVVMDVELCEAIAHLILKAAQKEQAAEAGSDPQAIEPTP